MSDPKPKVVPITGNTTPPKLLDPERVNIEDLNEGTDILVTKRGFRLKFIPIPSEVMLKARQRVPVPKPPLRDDPEKPGQQFEVLGDPKYTEEMEEYSRVINELSIKIMAAYGIVAYAIPEGMYGPDDDGWVPASQDAEIFTVNGQNYAPEVPSKEQPRARFVSWLRLYVLSENDGQPLYDALIHGIGTVMEQDVEEAVDSFPDREGRNSPNGVGTPTALRKTPTS